MKKYFLTMIVILALVSTSSVLAAPGSDPPSNQKFIPVLVNVNAHGKVTKADPAYRLRSAQAKAIKKAIVAMISKPAMKDGHAVSSQFVINFALVPDADHAGTYKLTYLSTKPIPPGNWHWTVQNNGVGPLGSHKMALTSDTGAPRFPISRVPQAYHPPRPQRPAPPPSSGQN